MLPYIAVVCTCLLGPCSTQALLLRCGSPSTTHPGLCWNLLGTRVGVWAGLHPCKVEHRPFTVCTVDRCLHHPCDQSPWHGLLRTPGHYPSCILQNNSLVVHVSRVRRPLACSRTAPMKWPLSWAEACPLRSLGHSAPLLMKPPWSPGRYPLWSHTQS
jgi:hypothetical protein